MKPIDYRNETFADLQARITKMRSRVLDLWNINGPCTTAELAERTGTSILTLRPRTTELYQIGAVILISGKGTEGVYRAASTQEMLNHFSAAKREVTEPQAELPLG